jgi:hypothetical protein
MPSGRHPDAEIIFGVTSAVLALADALDDKGVLTLEDYRASLLRLWEQMPDDDAGSGSGFVFETLIDLLNAAITQRG